MHVRSDGGLVENPLLQESIEWNFFLSGQFRENVEIHPNIGFWGVRIYQESCVNGFTARKHRKIIVNTIFSVLHLF